VRGTGEKDIDLVQIVILKKKNENYGKNNKGKIFQEFIFGSDHILVKNVGRNVLSQNK